MKKCLENASQIVVFLIGNFYTFGRCCRCICIFFQNTEFIECIRLEIGKARAWLQWSQMPTQIINQAFWLAKWSKCFRRQKPSDITIVPRQWDGRPWITYLRQMLIVPIWRTRNREIYLTNMYIPNSNQYLSNDLCVLIVLQPSNGPNGCPFWPLPTDAMQLNVWSPSTTYQSDVLSHSPNSIRDKKKKKQPILIWHKIFCISVTLFANSSCSRNNIDSL